MCTKVSNEYLAEMQQLDEMSKEAEQKRKPKLVSLPTQSSNISSYISTPPSQPYEKRKLPGNSTLDKSFNNQCREHLDFLFARAFYSAGLPFQLAKNPYFIEMIKYAANNNLAGYIPPDYNKLRITLLQKEMAHIEKLLRSIENIWKEKSLSIVSDGWTDVQKSHLSIL